MNKDINIKLFKVFSRKLAYLLRIEGFKIVGTEPNFIKPEFNIWLFEDTQEFREAFTRLQANK